MDNINEYVTKWEHENQMERLERTIRRFLFIILAQLAVIMFMAAVFTWAWCQYDYSSTSTSVIQGGKGINIVGDSNEVGDGASSNN